MKKQKQQVKQTVDSIEAIKDLGSEVKKTADDAVKGAVSDLWKQMLGKGEYAQVEAKEGKKQGELKPGEELDLRAEKKVVHIEPGIDYVREVIHGERKIEAKESHETKVKIQEILIEIKKLTASSKELEIQFKDVTIEQIPEGAGKYHSNFVEWVLVMIRSARERVDHAVTWTSALKGKKNQKQYWSLFKKHGTSFGLSGERVVATQVG